MTTSSNFPTVFPLQPLNGAGDAFVSVLNAAGSAQLYSTFLGGAAGLEHGYGIAVDSHGSAYVTGSTTSTNFPTAGPYQGAFGGSATDAFVAKIVNAAAVPVNVTATATSPTSVTITWTGSPGAASYELLRNGGTGIPFFAPTANTNFVDTFVVPDTAYLYRVRAVDGVSGMQTFYSDPDLATTVLFTDDPIALSITPVKVSHITELRTAVNEVRVLAGLSPFVFTDGIVPGLGIKKVHIEELRAALNEARMFLVLPALTYTDPVLMSGTTRIKAVHIEELRSGVK